MVAAADIERLGGAGWIGMALSTGVDCTAAAIAEEEAACAPVYADLPLPMSVPASVLMPVPVLAVDSTDGVTD